MERVALLWSTLTKLLTVFRDSSTGKGKLCFGEPNLCRNRKFNLILKNTLSILSTVFRDFSSGKCACVLKHPNYPVNCVQELQLWKVWLYSETSQPSCQLCSGIPVLEREAVFWNTLTILSTVFREFSSGTGAVLWITLIMLSTVLRDSSTGKGKLCFGEPNLCRNRKFNLIQKIIAVNYGNKCTWVTC